MVAKPLYIGSSGSQGLNYDAVPQHTKRQMYSFFVLITLLEVHISNQKIEKVGDGSLIHVVDSSTRSIDLNKIINDLQPDEIDVILDLV